MVQHVVLSLLTTAAYASEKSYLHFTRHFWALCHNLLITYSPGTRDMCLGFFPEVTEMLWDIVNPKVAQHSRPEVTPPNCDLKWCPATLRIFLTRWGNVETKEQSQGSPRTVNTMKT